MVRQLIQAGALYWLLTAAGCLAIVSGCTINLKDKGEYGVEFTHGVRAYSTASETKSKASIGLDFPSVEEWIMQASKADPTPPPGD